MHIYLTVFWRPTFSYETVSILRSREERNHLERCAWHEAGHAVALLYFGHLVKEAVIYPYQTGSKGGYVTYSMNPYNPGESGAAFLEALRGKNWWPHYSLFREWLIIQASGPVNEQVFLPKSMTRDLSQSEDFRSMLSFCFNLGVYNRSLGADKPGGGRVLTLLEFDWIEETTLLLSRPEMTRCSEYLAEELLTHRVLGADDIIRTVEQAFTNKYQQHLFDFQMVN